MMHSFIRWGVTPEIEGYDVPDGLPIGCPQHDKTVFALPFKWGDRLTFIAEAHDLRHSSAKSYKIGLMNVACENVAYDIGTYEVGEDTRQILIKCIMPNVPVGECYRLVWYEVRYDTGNIPEEAWETISTSCVTNSNGQNTGFQELVQEAEVTSFQRIPVVISNPLIRIRQNARTTKTLEFYDNRTRGVHFGYKYYQFPTAVQQLRLPVTIAEWQPSESDSVYRQTNGVFRRGNITIDEGYTLRTEYFDRATHRALNNALSHAVVMIEGIRYFKNSEYKAEHLETGDNPDRFYQQWIASCELMLQGYDQKNNACDYGETEFKLYELTYAKTYE